MSKNLAKFSDVKPLTRAAEIPSWVLIDITGCFLKKDRSYFFPTSDFFLVNWLFRTISYYQVTSHAFYVLTSQSIVSLVHNYAVLQKFILTFTSRTVLLPKCTFTSSSAEWNLSFTYLSSSSRHRKVFWSSSITRVSTSYNSYGTTLCLLTPVLSFCARRHLNQI